MWDFLFSQCKIETNKRKKSWAPLATVSEMGRSSPYIPFDYVPAAMSDELEALLRAAKVKTCPLRTSCHELRD